MLFLQRRAALFPRVRFLRTTLAKRHHLRSHFSNPLQGHHSNRTPNHLTRKAQIADLTQPEYHSINAAKMHDYSIKTDQYFLTVEARYEYLPLSLGEKLKSWRENKRMVPEAEIASLLLGVERALNDLASVGIKHRCINLNTVVCLKAVYKLVDSSMLTCKAF